MSRTEWAGVALALMVFPAQAAEPDEQGCRAAIAAAEHELARLAAQVRTAREREDLQRLMERQAAQVADNRRNGVSECVTWSQVMRMAFSQ